MGAKVKRQVKYYISKHCCSGEGRGGGEGEEKSLGKMKIAHVLLMTPLDAKSSRKYIFETARKNKHAFYRLACPAMKNANLGMVHVYLGGGREERGIDFVKNPMKAAFIRNIHLRCPAFQK